MHTSRFRMWALVAMAVLVVTAPAAPVEAASRFKTVTKQFRNATPIAIPGSGTGPGFAAPSPSQIAVSGLKRGRILDVDVVLHGYSHTCPDDVDVLVHGPQGQEAILMSDVGGCTGVNSVTVTLDDEAASQLQDETPPADGRYRPFDYDPSPSDRDWDSNTSLLSQYDGTNPNGVWELAVQDDTSGNTGQIASGWTLIIKARVRR